MKKNEKKFDEFSVGDNLRVVDDFLPPPSQIAFSEETIKITISLSKSSVDFFKKQARKNKTKYQRLIKNLLDQYANQYSPP